jgi:F-type H+-transporting ATPase subunit epsilon
MSDAVPGRLRLKVITPGRLLAEEEVDAVSLPSLEGEIGVLPGHIPMFVGLGRGRLRFTSGGREEAFAVRGGYAQIEPGRVVVMTDADEEDAADTGA